MEHFGRMTEIFRVQVERELLAEATRICRQIGTTPSEVTRMMLKQLVIRREIPFPLMADAPEADELAPRAFLDRMADQL